MGMLETLSPEARCAFVERFVTHYVVSDGCWLWTGAKNEKGYGIVGLPGGRTTKAHRVALEIQGGPFAASLCVLHRCDAPACVRPSHLFLGSRSDNNADMRSKGRAVPGGTYGGMYARGERHGQAVLTRAKVEDLRVRHAAGESFSQLAAAFGIGLTTAFKAVKGITWQPL